MSNRERWTVYPLLFLTLGIALKDKVFREVVTDRMICRALLVTDRKGEVQVAADATSTGGRVTVRGVNQQSLMLGFSEKLLGLIFINPRGTILPPSLVRPLLKESPRRAPQNAPPATDQLPPEADETVPAPRDEVP